MIKEIIGQSVFFLTFLKYMNDFYRRFQRGFRKGFGVLSTLLPVIEKWRESLDQGVILEHY